MVAMLDRVDTEISQVLGEVWSRLKAQNDTFVARHTLMVLALIVNDDYYK